MDIGRKLRVCIYGGTDLDGMPAGFVSNLAAEVLTTLPAVIVTGGFRRRRDRPEAVSTDMAALEGAKMVASRKKEDLRSLFEAWIPEKALDGRPDVGGVVRMTPGLGITVRISEGRTALGRRLSMVGAIDVLVTISGKRHTEVVLEQAIELGVPALPIPHAGGDSERLYELYADRIQGAFAPGAVRECFALLTHRGLEDPASVRSVVDVIRTARLGRCLILQPYSGANEDLYASKIKPAVEEQMVALRLKDAHGSQQIYSSFFDAVSHSTAIIADITDLNVNVMYEVGYAHGRGLQPLLFTLDPSRIDSLPLYFGMLNVHTVSRDKLPALIRDHLADIKRQRAGAPPLPQAVE